MSTLCCGADRVRHDEVERYVPAARSWVTAVRIMHWKRDMVFWHWSDTIIEDRAIPS